jgi:hypothetical protein
MWQWVNFVDGLTNDTQVNIKSASVVDFVVKTGNTQFTPVASVNADGTLTVTGLSSGDQVKWMTSGTHDRVLIQNISNVDGVSGNDSNTFDIGGFSLTSANAASAVFGTAVHFEDDGPTAAIVQGAPTVAHDETAGVQATPTTRLTRLGSPGRAPKRKLLPALAASVSRRKRRAREWRRSMTTAQADTAYPAPHRGVGRIITRFARSRAALI